MLAEDPDLRPNSMAEVAKVFERFKDLKTMELHLSKASQMSLQSQPVELEIYSQLENFRTLYNNDNECLAI